MKKTILIILGVVIVVGGAVVVFTLTREPQSVTEEPGVTFPIADPLSPSMRSSLTIEGDGVEMLVYDFLKAEDAVEDAANPGYYYLGFAPPEGELPDTSPYQILYVSETDYFNVAILQEPIGEMRIHAENDLKARLGLSTDDMCRLNYTVSVPNAVNSIYTGMNLGFSFCPGAVKLP